MKTPCRCGPASGSSPRTWGTQLSALVEAWVRRFIPTDVGNTSKASSTATAAPVHPHGRGEHAHRRRRRSAVDGSSPRTWGTRDYRSRQQGRNRFIPTDVGNTTGRHRSPSGSPVHPHGRGEHQGGGVGGGHADGSSPRTWGTPHRGPALAAINRFIPTDVGNT